MMIEILAVLAIGAAIGLRVGLPLLLVGLISGDRLWTNLPLLAKLPPTLVLGTLVSGTIAELILSKDRYGQRLLYPVELILSFGAGVVAGVGMGRTLDLPTELHRIAGLISGLIALVIQLSQVGWFYRPQPLPVWLFFMLDGLCISLVVCGFYAPQLGGVIALLLLWLVLRTAYRWRTWFGRGP
ncbi:MAG: DUF4126 family protein [Cyanobacteria bacterium REEB459]|nr:DUF4126 family protein [Cyanobacteria bacterium REEB459]